MIVTCPKCGSRHVKHGPGDECPGGCDAPTEPTGYLEVREPRWSMTTPWPNAPPDLQDRLRESHNALVAAVIECWGADSPLVTALGGIDYHLPTTESDPWYGEYLESEKE